MSAKNNRITLYPDVIKGVLIELLKYKLDMIDLYSLKSSIWQAALNISAHEDEDISGKLMFFEGELDEVQVSYEDKSRQKEEALIVIRDIEEYCYSVIAL